MFCLLLTILFINTTRKPRTIADGNSNRLYQVFQKSRHEIVTHKRHLTAPLTSANSSLIHSYQTLFEIWLCDHFYHLVYIINTHGRLHKRPINNSTFESRNTLILLYETLVFRKLSLQFREKKNTTKASFKKDGEGIPFKVSINHNINKNKFW